MKIKKKKKKKERKKEKSRQINDASLQKFGESASCDTLHVTWGFSFVFYSSQVFILVLQLTWLIKFFWSNSEYWLLNNNKIMAVTLRQHKKIIIKKKGNTLLHISFKLYS